MPEVEPDEGQQLSRLLPVLFWAGVGLAGLSALLLLAGGAGLRVGGFLGMAAIVAIGFSIRLRPDPVLGQSPIEETLLSEIDMLRAELREQVASSARATHQNMGERLGALHHAVETVRAEARAAGFGHAGVVPPRGAAPVPSAPPVRAAAQAPPPPSAPPAGHGRAGVAAVRRGARVERRRPEAGLSPVGRAAPTSGVYHHTETVQVTRSTYVDEHRPGEHAGYPDEYGQQWSTMAPRSRVPEDFSRSPEEFGRPAEDLGGAWTDEKLRESYDRRQRPYHQSELDSIGWSGGDEPRQPASPAPVSRGRRRRWDKGEHTEEPAVVANGERWASVHTDQRGRELRIGERRTSRHSDERGSELRIEDRWAAVRRDAGLDDERAAYPEPAYPEPDYQPPALPAASSQPAWNEAWEEPVRQTRGHRYRAEDDDGYHGSRRRLGFERTDERWR